LKEERVVVQAIQERRSHQLEPMSMTVVDTVWPEQINHHGTLFGGAALATLDKMAFIVASKVLYGSVVTAAVSRLDFLAPAIAGCIVECTATVVHKGRRSVTVQAKLIAEDLLTGHRVECLQGEFVMVKSKEEGAQQVSIALDQGDQQFQHDAHERRGVAGADSLIAGASAVVAEIIFPGHVNHRGILHGGPTMAWMTKAGFVAASREVRRTVVMASSDRLNFEQPAHVGEVVEVIAQVVGKGNRSLQVHVQMWAESVQTGERRICASAGFVYVVVV
jgi:acyl-CoA hydrolase